MIVADASITVGWLLNEESAIQTADIYKLILDSGAIGPAIYPVEVANALRSALRRKSIDIAKRDAALSAFARLVAQDTGLQPSLAEIVAISDRHDITPYDASYVALAKSRGLILATTDAAMARAARAEGLTVLP